MNKFTIAIFALFISLSAVTAYAETRQYNIEIVIFEDSSDRYINSEQWPVIHNPENFSDQGINITESYKKPQYHDTNSVINITHNTSNALAESVAKLKRSSRYNVLLHQSWQQTGLNDTDAFNIQIDTREEENRKTDDVKLFIPNHQPAHLPKKSNIQGTLKLTLGRYLHIHTDLLYQRLKKNYDPTSSVLYSSAYDEFKIQSQRRMRSKELHYIDHPLLGILVLAVPVEQPEANEKSEPLTDIKAKP